MSSDEFQWEEAAWSGALDRRAGLRGVLREHTRFWQGTRADRSARERIAWAVLGAVDRAEDDMGGGVFTDLPWPVDGLARAREMFEAIAREVRGATMDRAPVRNFQEGVFGRHGQRYFEWQCGCYEYRFFTVPELWGHEAWHWGLRTKFVRPPRSDPAPPLMPARCAPSERLQRARLSRPHPTRAA
jgi:hypothetical protein